MDIVENKEHGMMKRMNSSPHFKRMSLYISVPIYGLNVKNAGHTYFL